MKCTILSLVTSLVMAGAALAGKKFWQEIPFPREEAREIDLRDKTIEFATKISDQKISRKFKLKDMVLDGTPAF